ncbi:MAG: VWA domain-containing protein, partial [Thermodesulfobacteriota bacterium]
MIPESFHFLRPAWLLALLPAALLLWAGLRTATRASAWRRVVDAHLLRHLMLTDGGAARRWPLALAGLALGAACVALAGPAWQRVPQPTFAASQPVVVALDMSPSMAASDVRPSRLARARHELHDLLARTRGAQVGLVLYADEPFVAVPLTDDARVIEEMVPSLESGLMPLRRGRADRAIAQASALLEQAGAASGRIVLLTGGVEEHGDAALDAARGAAARGHALSVLGIGDEPGLDVDGLQRLAAAGGGRFAAVTADDADLAA